MRFAARILLIVALLLPFRGALAAAGLFCHDSGERQHGAAHVHVHHDHAADAGTGGGAVSDSGEHGEWPAKSASCSLCSSVCSTPPVPSASADVFRPSVARGERFPALAPPRFTVALGGVERPPRSH
jgi:hypothetical protein